MNGRAAGEMRDDIGEAVRTAADKLARDVSKAAHEAREAAAEFASKVQDSTGALGERAAELGDRAVDRARDAAAGVRRNMREHPFTWVVAAAGVGALVAFLFARRR